MDEYTLWIGKRSIALRGTQLDAVRASARIAHRWGRGESATVESADGPVTIDRPPDWRDLEIRIAGPWRRDENPWSRPG